MTLPVHPNSISANQVNVELGRAAGASFNLNESAVRDLAQRPTAGTVISFADLRGKSSWPSTPAVTNPLAPIPVGDDSVMMASSQAGIGIRNDGTWYTWGNLNTRSGTWLTGGTVGDIEVRITPTSGSFSGNTASNWVNCNSGASASRSRTSLGTSSVTFRVEFRNRHTGVLLSTTLNCRLSATYETDR